MMRWHFISDDLMDQPRDVILVVAPAFPVLMVAPSPLLMVAPCIPVCVSPEIEL